MPWQYEAVSLYSKAMFRSNRFRLWVSSEYCRVEVFHVWEGPVHVHLDHILHRLF